MNRQTTERLRGVAHKLLSNPEARALSDRQFSWLSRRVLALMDGGTMFEPAEYFAWRDFRCHYGVWLRTQKQETNDES